MAGVLLKTVPPVYPIGTNGVQITLPAFRSMAFMLAANEQHFVSVAQCSSFDEVPIKITPL